MQEKNVVTTTEHRCRTVHETSKKVVGCKVTYRLDGKKGVPGCPSGPPRSFR